MVKYGREASSVLKSCKARCDSVRVHFKNTHETAAAIRRMTLERAKKYLKDVIDRKECVPFKRFRGSVGRCAQAKQFGVTQGRWPKKSAKILLELLKNAESNAYYYGLDIEKMVIGHIQVIFQIVIKFFPVICLIFEPFASQIKWRSDYLTKEYILNFLTLC